MRASQHAFRHTRKHTHRDIHHGESCHLNGFLGLYTPQAPRAPVHSTRPLNSAKHDRTHLVVHRLKEAYYLPLFLVEAT